MGIRVAVAGASGYAGGELLRLLAGHPDLEIAAVAAGSSAGQPITSIHPNLTGHPAFDGKNFAPTDAATLGDAELIFLALPHGESARLADQLPDARIVDLSADFRLEDDERLAPVLRRRLLRRPLGLRAAGTARRQPSAEKIKAARTVAAPGCYATTAILALAPLLAAGLVEPSDIVVVAASGTSGAGRSLQYRPARQRGHGVDVGLQGRRHPPAHPGDRAGPVRGDAGPGHGHRCPSPRRWPRCPAASSPPAPPGSRQGHGRRRRHRGAARSVRRGV